MFITILRDWIEERGRQRFNFCDAETVPVFSKVIYVQEFAAAGNVCGALTRKQLQKLVNIADFELRMFELFLRKMKCRSI